MEPEPGQRKEVHKSVKGLKNRRPESDSEIHQVGRMVCDVRRPKKPHFVVESVQPVIQEIFCNEQQNPVQPHIFNLEEAVIVEENVNSEVENAEQHVDSHICQHEVDVRQDVFPGVQTSFLVAGNQNLRTNNEDIDRCADKNYKLFAKIFHSSCKIRT